jgi:transglutaminase-like putative cysteine protease
MNFKTPMLTLFVTTLYLNLLAQETSIKWGKIPDEELKMTTYALDTAAAAVVLADIGYFTYDLRAPDQLTELNVHRRIKILKRSGFSEGDIEIPFYSKDRYQDIVQLKAQIFNPDGSKRSIEKKDFFEEKTAEGYTTKKFTFPEIQVGSIIEYSYVMQTKDWVRIPTWYFQTDIPVRLSEYVLNIPEFLEFVIIVRGSELDRNEQSLESGIGIRNRKYILAVMDAPALKEEAFITTMTDYTAHVIFQISGVVQNGVREPYLSDWKTVAKDLLESENFGKRIDRKANFNDAYDKVAPLVANAKTPEEKIKTIYHFVLDQIKWDGTNGIYQTEPLNKVFELKKGDAAGVNLMLIALLKAYGFEAKPFLVSTRGHGQPIELYPIRSQFNYVLAYLKHNDKVQLLDATHRQRPMGLPATSALNNKGWIVDAEPEWLEIVPGRSSSTRMFNITLNEEGKAVGKIVSAYDGYAALEVREELTKKDDPQSNNEAPEEDKDEEVSATLANIEYDSVTVKNLDDIYKTLAYNAKVVIPEGGTVNGDFIYLTPVLHPAFDENPFKQTVREYPVDIPYPLSHRYILNLTIPEGYAIEQMPEQVSLSLPENGGKFTFLVSKPAGTIRMLQINSTIQINQVHFEPEEYGTIKKFFDLIIEKQQEQLVLKKI